MRTAYVLMLAALCVVVGAEWGGAGRGVGQEAATEVNVAAGSLTCERIGSLEPRWQVEDLDELLVFRRVMVEVWNDSVKVTKKKVVAGHPLAARRRRRFKLDGEA